MITQKKPQNYEFKRTISYKWIGVSINGTASEAEAFTTVTVNTTDHMESNSKVFTEYNLRKSIEPLYGCSKRKLRKPKPMTKYLLNAHNLKPWLKTHNTIQRSQLNEQKMVKKYFEDFSLEKDLGETFPRAYAIPRGVVKGYNWKLPAFKYWQKLEN